MVASSAVGAGVVVRRVFNSAIAAVPRVFSVADLRDHLSEALPQWQAYMLDHLEDGSLHQVASDAPVFYKHLSGEPPASGAQRGAKRRALLPRVSCLCAPVSRSKR